MSDAPTPEQARAIEARDRDVFCEAGAGSGKTRVLVGRYAAAVADDGIAPDAILAMTFTERAAAELRERIRGELGRRAAAARKAGDHVRAAELRRAARDTEGSWVTTIHGFCRRLLATHPAAAGLDPRFRVLDDAEAKRLAERSFSAAVEELAGDSDGADLRVRALASGYRLDRMGELLQTAHDRLRTQGCDPPVLPAPGPPVRSLKKEDEPALSDEEVKAAAEGHAALALLLERYHQLYEAAKAERSGLDFVDLELRALALLRHSEAVAQAWRERFTHIMVDEFQDTNRVQLGLVEALRGPETRLFVVGDEHQSIYRFRFADLEVFRARRAAAAADPATDELPLRGNFRSRPEVLAAVNLVGEALLDGYVPLTAGREVPADPVAAPVELLLTDCSEDKPGRAVGWRDEEIELEPPPSERNPAHVAEARALAERLRELADEGTPRGDMVVLLRAFTHVDAFEEALDRAGLDPYVVGGRGYWSQQQVEDLLRMLGTLANPLDDEVLFGALSGPACGASADALWLLRQAAGPGRHVWPVLDERFGSGEATTEAEPAEGAEDQLVLVAEERDGEDGPERRGDPGALDEIGDGDGERLRRFCAIVAGLRTAAPLAALDELVEQTMSSFDYDLALLARPRGRLRMANVRKLMRLAREYEEHEGRDLRGFLAFAERRTVRDDREGVAALRVEGHDGVRVMTVHAAKGLEFPVVAVADLGRGLAAGGGGSGIAIGRLEGELGDSADARFGMRLQRAAAESLRLWELVELESEERDADAEEACRLTYVAASRAMDRLILSGSYSRKQLEAKDPRPGDSALRRLLPRLASGGDDEEAEPQLAAEIPIEPALDVNGAGAGAASLVVRVTSPSPERTADLRRRREAPEPATEAAKRAAPPLLEGMPRRSPVGHLSYSALADYERCGYRFYVERVVGVGPEAIEDRAEDPAEDDVGPIGAARELRLARGNAVHAALEWSARRGWQEPGPEELAAICSRAGLGPDCAEREAVAELVRAWIGSELCAELAGEGMRLRPEVPFAIEVAGTVIRGSIDLLATGPRGTLVLDYKTDRLDGADPAALAERYSAQRDLYALAAATAAGTDAVRTAYCFLADPAQPVLEDYDAERLEGARERAGALIGAIRRGRFERTAEPTASVCFGCPAASRLCSAPAWSPGR
jgi:ATP-dependent exoDNAse (exonuclease V) beta subunit